MNNAIRILLQSFGISIDPVEVETAFAQAKEAMPQLLAFCQSIDERLKRIEAALGPGKPEVIPLGGQHIVITCDGTSSCPHCVTLLASTGSHAND